jgi:hypothetical protein
MNRGIVVSSVVDCRSNRCVERRQEKSTGAEEEALSR